MPSGTKTNRIATALRRAARLFALGFGAGFAAVFLYASASRVATVAWPHHRADAAAEERIFEAFDAQNIRNDRGRLDSLVSGALADFGRKCASDGIDHKDFGFFTFPVSSAIDSVAFAAGTPTELFAVVWLEEIDVCAHCRPGFSGEFDVEWNVSRTQNVMPVFDGESGVRFGKLERPRRRACSHPGADLEQP